MEYRTSRFPLTLASAFFLLAACSRPVELKQYGTDNQAPRPPEADIQPFDLSLPRPTKLNEEPPKPPVTLAGEGQRPGNPETWGETATLAVGRKFDPIIFEQGRAELDLNDQRGLQEYALWLRQHPRVWLVLAGHCDLATTPGYAYNLGQARALAVQDYLASQGIPAWRSFCISYGSSLPISEGKTPDAHAMNNRVEVLGFMQPAGVEAPAPVDARDADSPGIAPPARVPIGENLQ